MVRSTTVNSTPQVGLVNSRPHVGLTVQQTYLEDGYGTDGDQDDHPDVHLGGEPCAVVGVVVAVVLLWVVQHVVIVPARVLILGAKGAG